MPVLLCCLGALAALIWYLRLQRGAAANPADLAHSAHYDGRIFQNAEPVLMPRFGPRFLLDFLTSRERPAPLPVCPLTRVDFVPPASLKVYWMGHSFLIVEVDGTRLLTDPVYGAASPLPGGVRRFQAPPVPLEQLPPLDAVIISHDHYDHLERSTVRYLAARGNRFVTPLGMGARLRGWGCADVTELDWHQSVKVGNVNIIAAPSRHFSGRSLLERNTTLWASWVLLGPEHRVFFSSDGGYGAHFTQIGEQYGPFNVTLMETGAWDKRWPHSHQKPEESVKAHLDVRGDVMLPIHWAAYNLAFHPWDEPIRRTVKAAEAQGVTLATPRMGQGWTPNMPTDTWWETVH